jgi:hypothetical protein
MVIAAFYVLTSDVSAEPVSIDSEVPSIQKTAQVHDNARITISNGAAISPSVVVDNEGIIHIVWTGVEGGSYSIYWKRSNDSLSTFTSDKQLSTSFKKISNVSLACDPNGGVISIAFEGRINNIDASDIYLIYSTNGGLSWSGAFKIGEGSSPQLAVSGTDIFMGASIASEAGEYFSVLEVNVCDETNVSCSSVISLPISVSSSSLMIASGILHYVVVNKQTSVMYYGNIELDDGVAITPSQVCDASSITSDVQLLLCDGKPTAVFCERREGWTEVRTQQLTEKSMLWINNAEMIDRAIINDMSTVYANGKYYIAWTTESEIPMVSLSIFDSDLKHIEHLPEINTSNLSAGEPCIFAMLSGVVSCIYVESHVASDELFLFHDIEFVIPSIKHLKKVVTKLDAVLFINGDTSKTVLVNKIDEISELITNYSNEETVVAINDILSNVGNYFNGVPFSSDSKELKTKFFIEKQLKAIKDDIESENDEGLSLLNDNNAQVSILSSNVVYPPVFEDVTSTSVRVRWSTSFSVSSVTTRNYAEYSISGESQYTRIYGTRTGSRSCQAEITGLIPGTTYDVTVASYYSGIFYENYGSFSTESLEIGDIEFTDDFWDEGLYISWYTPFLSNSTVYYGLTASYGNIITDNTMAMYHQIIISTLEPDTVYHFMLESSNSTISVISDDIIHRTSEAQLSIENLSVCHISQSSVIINWTTLYPSTTEVDYWLVSPVTTVVSSNGTSHSVVINNLQLNKNYRYRVRSVSLNDTSNTATSSQAYFSTYVVRFTQINVGEITTSSAKITWQTVQYYPTYPEYSLSTWGGVEYGTNTSYGTLIEYDHLVVSHSITLTGLTMGTQYHIRLLAANSVEPDYYYYSDDIQFTTLEIIISGITVVNFNPTMVKIDWTTNIIGDGVVQYGLTPSYGSMVSGTSGTSHTAWVGSLTSGTLYHYRIASTSLNGSTAYSSDRTFTTWSIDDLGQGIDAGNSIQTAARIVPGNNQGDIDPIYDTCDFYSLYLLSGQTLTVDLIIPAGTNLDLALYNPGGTLVATSTNGVGIAESIYSTIATDGMWFIKVSYTSGTTQARYALHVGLPWGTEVLQLDVGSTGDNVVDQHILGFCLADGTGWYSPVNGMREGAKNSSFYMNIYDLTYQATAYYQMAISYTATAKIGLEVFNGYNWVSVVELPSNSAWAHSFIIKADTLFDASETMGFNAQFRFDHQVIVDSINAIPYAFGADLFNVDSNDRSVIDLENGWTIDDAVVNGTSSSTIIITPPISTNTYFLEFVNLDSCSGVGVQQWDGTNYVDIGTLESWGTSAVIQLNPALYFDACASLPGINLRIRLTASIINLAQVVLWTSMQYTDVGTSGESDVNAHLLGISILECSEWSVPTTVDGKTVRSTMSGQYANFYLNGALSDRSYRITMTYKTTSPYAVIRQWRGSALGYYQLGALTCNGQWNTITFSTLSSEMFDYVAGGQLNVLFEVTSGTPVTVDSIKVCADSDGDSYSDAYEALRTTIADVGTHVYDLDPFSADSDSDGLNDNVEVSSYGTNPCNPDTDNDGLLDGSEKYSYTWSTDDTYLIPDNNTWLNIPISVPAIQGGASAITSFCLVLGIMHESQYQLEIKIAKGTGTQKAIKAANTGSGANYFILRNLFVAASPFTSPYTAADLSTGAEWHIYVRDATPGTQGRVEYARLQVNGTTNPLDSDSDDDLILDGEEVEFGDDGWYTNPRSADSDSDGVSDRNEILGNTLCGSVTDPTRADTDDDGYADNTDKYLGDAVIRLTILECATNDTINGHNPVNVFYEINYVEQGQEFATKRITTYEDTLYYPNWVYDIDIPETATSVHFDIAAVAENAGLWGDDQKLDIDHDSTDEYNIAWTNLDEPFEGMGYDSGGSYDAYVKVRLERTVAQKANVIVINGTGNDGDYGLDTVSSGEYRYSADDQVYLINLNVIGSNAHFSQGMNTIILPRAIALQCQLNDTLYDLASLSSGDPLYGASFYSTDASSATASGHVIAVISTNVSVTNAEVILWMLTHNSTDGRIGNNVTISSASLYLLHLPSDILSSIPTSVTNAGMGEGHYYFDPVHQIYMFFTGITDIAGMIFDFLVWVATGGVLLLFVHLVEMGLEAIGNLLSAAASAVQDAVDAIVDAFCAFVDWVIEQVTNLFNSLIAEPLNNLWESLEAWVLGLLSTVKNVCSGIDDGEIGVFHAAEEVFDYIFGSSTVRLLMAIVTLIVIGVSLMECFTGPFGFIMLLISPILMDLLMQGLVSAMSGAHWLIDSMIDGADQLCSSIVGFFISEGVQLGTTVVSVISVLGSFFFSKLSFFGDVANEDFSIRKKMYSAGSFFCSCVGLILFWIDVGDDQDDNDILDFFGLAMSGTAIYCGLRGDVSSIVGKIGLGFSVTGMLTGVMDVMD